MARIRAVVHLFYSSPVLVSIIIPALNEAQCIADTLHSLQQQDPPFEIIVVDGGSEDNTVSISSRYARVISSERGRANQMNAGARVATGDVLLFLHADTRLPDHALQLIRDSFTHSRYEAGIFRLRFDQHSCLLRFYSYCTRYNQPRFCFGDRALFVKRDVFKELNGFTPIPIFEDLDLSIRLYRRGRFLFRPEYATTAARRFEEKGPLKQQLLNTFLWLRYTFGASPFKLARYYTYKRTCEERESVETQQSYDHLDSPHHQ